MCDAKIFTEPHLWLIDVAHLYSHFEQRKLTFLIIHFRYTKTVD